MRRVVVAGVVQLCVVVAVIDAGFDAASNAPARCLQRPCDPHVPCIPKARAAVAHLPRARTRLAFIGAKLPVVHGPAVQARVAHAIRVLLVAGGQRHCVVGTMRARQRTLVDKRAQGQGRARHVSSAFLKDPAGHGRHWKSTGCTWMSALSSAGCARCTGRSASLAPGLCPCTCSSGESPRIAKTSLSYSSSTRCCH